MHHEITRALYDAFPLERKGDFFEAYLYLKYTEHFVKHGFRASGLTARELPDLDEGIEEMLQALNQHIGDAAMSADTSLYHGKVMKLQDAIKLVTQKEDVNLSPPERVVPFKLARDIVLQNPHSIVVGTCPCRSVSLKSCLPPPMEVCLFFGDPWASFMDEQNPKYHKISQEEAVKVLEFCHEKGFVHTAYFEHAAGYRLDALCNCCSCCCTGIKMWNLMEGALPLLAPSGYVSEVSDECNGCGSCAENTCHFQAISLDEDGQKAVINLQKCMGCGVCVDVCPVGAVSLRREPSKGDPLDIEELKRTQAA